MSRPWFECLDHLRLTEVLAPKCGCSWACGMWIKLKSYDSLDFSECEVNGLLSQHLQDAALSEPKHLDQMCLKPKSNEYLSIPAMCKHFYSVHKKAWVKRKGDTKRVVLLSLFLDRQQYGCWHFTLLSPTLQALMGYSKSRGPLELSADWQNYWESSSAMEKGYVFSQMWGWERCKAVWRAQTDWCGAGKHIINLYCYTKNA